MKRSLKELAEFIGAQAVGDSAVEVLGVASVRMAREGELVFAEDAPSLEKALTSAASAVICGDFGDLPATAKPLLLTAQPRLAFARAATLLYSREDGRVAVHPTAVVDPSAQLAEAVMIGPHAVIGKGVSIGAGTSIGAGSVLAAGVIIGSNCELYPNVTVYSDTRIGDRVIVHAGAVLGSDGFGYVRDRDSGRYEKFPQVGRLEIEDDVEIGANSTIDRGALEVTRIGKGSKIDNLVHIGHNCELGENVIVAAQTGMGGSSIAKDDVVMGGQVGIADHVRIEAGVIVGAQAGVPTKKVLRGRGVVFWGTPATPLKGYLKQLAVLARLAKRS